MIRNFHSVWYLGAAALCSLAVNTFVSAAPLAPPKTAPLKTATEPMPAAKAQYRLLHVFESKEGASISALVREGNVIYGVAQAGGAATSGTVWRMNEDGSEFQILHTFEMREDGATRSINRDGSSPTFIMAGGDGFLYGIARESGPHGQGTLWRARTDGAEFQVLHAFAVSAEQEKARIPANPLACLVAAPDGFLIGGCAQDGKNGRGTIWKIARDGGGFQILHDFDLLKANTSTPENPIFPNATGANPQFVTAGGSGLLGTASNGGKNGGGVIWGCALDGSDWRVLHNFQAPFVEATLTPNRDGLNPVSIIEYAGRLFGVCNEGGTIDGHLAGQGTLWAMDKTGENFRVLKTFENDSRRKAYRDGSQPFGRLTVSKSGWLYGVTRVGGAPDPYIGNGTLFRLLPDGQNFSVVYAADIENEIEGNEQPFPVRLLAPSPQGLLAGVGIEEEDTPRRREQLFLFTNYPD